MNMKNLLQNWKTTSAGLSMILGSVVHLGFAIKNHTADETTWTTTSIAIIGGLGLLFAGDANPTGQPPAPPVKPPGQ
jgi:hypothetical protein